ncbi:hypothetical protein Lser_V15G46063 [Lactuca serriola]
MDRISPLISTSTLLWFIFVLYSFSKVYGNSEGDALNALKVQLSDPNNVLQSWDPTLVNPCTWYHVTCNNENSVTRLELGNASLSGKLVPQLGQLVNLQYLELYSNKITGKIPKELGNLKNLVSLDLYMNRLEGRIPSTLGNLQKLRYLRLHHNTLTGTIPYSLTTITSLEVLDLSYNRLRGHVPVNGSFAMFTPKSFYHNPGLKLPVYIPPPPVATAPSVAIPPFTAPAPAPLSPCSSSGAKNQSDDQPTEDNYCL